MAEWGRCGLRNGRCVSLVKTLENHIGVEAVHELLVDVLKQRGGLRLDNANVVDASAGDFDHFPMHQGLHKLWCQLHAVDFVVVGRV